MTDLYTQRIDKRGKDTDENMKMIIQRRGFPGLRSSCLKPQELCKILDHSPSLAQKDIDQIQAEGYTFSLMEQDRTQALIQSYEFREWFISPRSELLLINASGESNFVSAASYACALLATSLAHTEILTLSFYCGLYVHPPEKETGVGPMLAKLIGQLLNYNVDFDLAFLVPGQKADLQALDIDLLCDTLKRLIRQIPRGHLIICTIDGVSFYKTSYHWQEMLVAVDTLVELVEEETETEAMIKILLLCPDSSINVARRLDPAQVFTLEEDFVRTYQGFNGDAYESEISDQLLQLKPVYATESDVGDGWQAQEQRGPQVW
ncbi:hypothetical protein Q9189_008125 [Teloschistes chrysophthalmus]